MMKWLAALALYGVSAFAHASEGTPVTVSSALIDLHTGPGRGYPIKISAVKGEQLQLLKTRGNWVLVEFRQQQLWMNDQELANLLRLSGEPYQSLESGRAAFEKRSMEFTAFVGDLNGASFYQFEYSYRFSDVVSVGLSAGQASGDNADTQIVEGRIYLDPFPTWYVSPYLGIGGGMNRTTPRTVLVQTEDRTDPIASVEVGVRYYLARNFVARAAYHRGVLATSRNENDEITTWKLGFSVFF